MIQVAAALWIIDGSDFPLGFAMAQFKEAGSSTQHSPPPEALRAESLAATPIQPPAATIRRMSLYLRELQRIEPSVVTISSRQLAARLDVSAEVVRRDLAILGSVGRRGVGYEISTLIGRLRGVLGSDTHWRVALVGAGSLGHALLRYQGFERLGFQLVAALDIDPRRIGEEIGGVTIRDAHDMQSIFRQFRPQLAILAVPADAAAAVAVKIVQAGVSGILNFAPSSLKLPGQIAVINVDLASDMQRLAFHVLQRERPADGSPAGQSKDKKRH